MGVNVKGTFLAAKAALAPMRRNRYGRMVFTSSINGFIKSAALEFAADGITVNGVEPGNILTEGMKAGRSPDFIRMMEQAVPLGRLGTPPGIAHAVLFLASQEAAYITGTTLIVDGGQTLPEGRDFTVKPTAA